MTEHFIVVFLTVTRLTYFEFAFAREDLITSCSLFFVFVFPSVLFHSMLFGSQLVHTGKNNSMANNLLIAVNFTYHKVPS